ncbi:M23 family metallopeptidase [Aliiroseovarius sp. S1123]|uniref:M23 family metallopeptidase n=1 Tax=unclassified Aliiroseovarius TaxID=2623558 RepID=UPI001FF690C4|nr:M23 family metallopeptidase [Aliiroseovarius sp. S1123]MCK0172279.1 M23 family metallopeptidase [Aliiroseovarius sp. S1123]
MHALWAATLITCAATPVAARDPVLSFPVACALGQDCFIQSYVDADPSNGAADFTCGVLSYDGHQGTDIALTSDMAAQAGVDVTPVAPGVVRRLRDGGADQFFSATFDHSDGQDCGNGVVIDHGGGWESQYCHMRKDSIAVEVGQRVGLQTPLGQIGMSGRTEFPHLHLTLRKDEQVVDPFNADPLTYCGDTDATSLWADEILYRASGFVNAGFSDRIPDFDTVKWGKAAHASIDSTSGAFVFWAQIFGALAGDEMQLIIHGPNGVFIEHEEVLETTQARTMRAAGRRLHAENTLPGTYHGTATLLRGGVEIDRIATTTTLTTP